MSGFSNLQSIELIQNRQHKKILVAPLNWGLGHATRCIPVIKALIQYDFQPILAGDGDSLQLLRQEFPELTYYDLPSTEVVYAEKGNHLKYKLLSQAPKLIRAVKLEKKRTQEIHKLEKLSGIISDNRFGVRSDDIPSVYITHQLQVLSGATTVLSSQYHRQIISKFKECWVPDFDSNELAGKLSKPGKGKFVLKYIGPLSRFTHHPQNKRWNIVAVLSGPEPQRGILEAKIKEELRSYSGKSLIIQGIVESKQSRRSDGNLTLVNFMLHQELGDVIEQGELILSRSGYSSVMDLYELGAKAYFIPTPGQFEQEYLAEHLKQKGYADFSKQGSFHIDKLMNTKNYEGFSHKKTSKNNLDRSLFDVFN